MTRHHPLSKRIEMAFFMKDHHRLKIIHSGWNEGMKKKKSVIVLFSLIILLVVFSIGADTLVLNVLRGKIHFPTQLIGDNLIMEDGQKFKVFRRLKVTAKNDRPSDLTIFKVRFKFKNLGASANKRLSMIPAPFLAGMEGFREKIWTFNENTGYFQGIYQWESREYAEEYPESFIFKLMAKRAAEGTLTYEIIPKADLSKYIDMLLKNTPHN